MAKPRFVMIADPNGAGKSTCAKALLEAGGGLIPFVNADVIAEGLSGFSPEAAAVQAGRIMVERIDELSQAGHSFAVETTLASRSYIGWLNKFGTDYETKLIFLHLSNPFLACERVANRVALGGHHIPESLIRRRYAAGLSNFFRIYKDRVDDWLFLDNSIQPARTMAWKKVGHHFSSAQWETLEQRYQS